MKKVLFILMCIFGTYTFTNVSYAVDTETIVTEEVTVANEKNNSTNILVS